MKIKANTEDAYWLLHDGALAFSKAEQVGLRIDTDYCKQAEKGLTEEINEIESNLMDTDFVKDWKDKYGRRMNFNSGTQLRDILYNVKDVEPIKTTESGKGSTSKNVLQKYDIEALDLLLEMRKIKKTRDTYLKQFMREEVNGKIHPRYDLHIARSYRSSGSNPNFQNIPKRDEKAKRVTRKAIYPRKGHQLLSVDYDGLEVRTGCFYHKDSKMIKYVKNENSDMHGDMAKQIFFLDKMDKSDDKLSKLRYAAKNGFIFPQFYGDYYVHNAQNICDTIELPKEGKWEKGQGVKVTDDKYISTHLIQNNIDSYEKFEKYMEDIEDDFWNRRFSEYQNWKDRIWQRYQETGEVRMLTGFTANHLMNKKQATNTPIQGTAFHCLLKSYIQLYTLSQQEDWDTELVGQIHDEIMLDVAPDELDYVSKKVEEVMCEWLPEQWDFINVPLSVEADITPVDGSWFEQEEYKI